jgi:hypothetical protein
MLKAIGVVLLLVIAAEVCYMAGCILARSMGCWSFGSWAFPALALIAAVVLQRGRPEVARAAARGAAFLLMELVVLVLVIAAAPWPLLEILIRLEPERWTAIAMLMAVGTILLAWVRAHRAGRTLAEALRGSQRQRPGVPVLIVLGIGILLAVCLAVRSTYRA